MDSLFAWLTARGSDEELIELGRLTLYFTSVDEAIIAAIEGLTNRRRDPAGPLPGDWRYARFTDHIECLKKVLSALRVEVPVAADLISELEELLKEVGGLNNDRRTYVHGSVRLQPKNGEIFFRGKRARLPARKIADLNGRTLRWIQNFGGTYMALYLRLNAKAE